MNLVKRIKAFFMFKGEKKEMEVRAAQVRTDGIFLHPAEDPNQTLFIKTSAVDIVINPDGEITEDDIFVVDKEATKKKSGYQKNSAMKKQQLEKEQEKKFNDEVNRRVKEILAKKEAENKKTDKPRKNVTPKKQISSGVPQEMKAADINTISLRNYFEPKKKITISFYEDEYNLITGYLKDNGYKKNEFFLACITAVKKQSMTSTYNRLEKERKERRKKEKAEARRRAEEEIQARQNNLSTSTPAVSGNEK